VAAGGQGLPAARISVSVVKVFKVEVLAWQVSEERTLGL